VAVYPEIFANLLFLFCFFTCPVHQVSNIMVNTNNNRNNNNNNDFQASLGAINTNQQSSQATQSTTTMTMIIVTPIGTPIVIPVGKNNILLMGLSHQIFWCLFWPV